MTDNNEMPQEIWAYKPKWSTGISAQIEPAPHTGTKYTRADRERPVDAWQPIETAPHGEKVLLFCPESCPISNKSRVELDYASHGTENKVTSSISRHAWATHWMPLPKPPKGIITPKGEGDD